MLYHVYYAPRYNADVDAHLNGNMLYVSLYLHIIYRMLHVSFSTSVRVTRVAEADGRPAFDSSRPAHYRGRNLVISRRLS